MMISYPGAKQIVVCGDIHGEFETLVYKACVQYGMHDTLIIVAGDCGFGFEKPAYYDNIYRRISKRLESNNNWIAMIRGNHDDPEYFQQQEIIEERWRTVPDYSVIEACGKSILCVGGAISVDRLWRKKAMMRDAGKSYYWVDEAPYFDENVISEITASGIKIDAVVTHTAPSFCELLTKNGLATWLIQDSELSVDCHNERDTLDKLYNFLQQNGHPLKQWYYGHFHESWYGNISGVEFSMLGIMDFKSMI